MIRSEYASWIAVFVLASIRMAFKLNAENGYQNVPESVSLGLNLL